MDSKRSHTAPSYQPQTQHKTSTNESPLVSIEMNFRAPVARLFEAWSSAEVIQQWWGPENFTCPGARIEFKVGGKYLLAMRSPDHQVIWTTGTYLEIQRNRKIVCTDVPSNSRGEEISAEEAGMGPWEDLGESYITVEFEALSSTQTKLTLSHEGLPARMHDECVDGWTSSLRKLKNIVEHH